MTDSPINIQDTIIFTPGHPNLCYKSTHYFTKVTAELLIFVCFKESVGDLHKPFQEVDITMVFSALSMVMTIIISIVYVGALSISVSMAVIGATWKS